MGVLIEKRCNTTDAMLWARKDGETFGIAIGEFSSKNKPVICMNIGYPAHIHILGNKALLYKNATDLYNLLVQFNPTIEKQKDWNAYTNFTPEKVMNRFRQVFL